MRSFAFFVIMMVGIMLVSCADEPESYECALSDTVSVAFDMKCSVMSRSIISPAESYVADFSVSVYRDGILAGHVFSDDGNSVSIDLVSGVSYNVYVLANVGNAGSYSKESDLIGKYMFSVSGISDMEEYVPMAGCVRDVMVKESGQRISVMLERLVSKILFSLDKSALDGLEIHSVRLCQSALCVRPFKDGGSAVLSVSEVADGDYCSESDLRRLNDGGEVVFYSLENAQGILLPGNQDPWLKIPSSLGDKSGLCTFIEVSCSFDGSGACEGDVVYRLCLGQDNCADFSILRNSVLDVSLYLSLDGLKEAVAWRVEPDYSVRDGLASGWVSCGRHGESDLYVGERFEYSFMMEDELTEYIGADICDCEVFFRSDDGLDTETVSFSGFKEADSGVYCAEAVCLGPGDGEICLRERNGRLLAVLSDNVHVSLPGIIISENPSDSGKKSMSGYDGTTPCYINGGNSCIHVYFVDDKMLNLNVSSACGYDLEVFDFDMEPDLDIHSGLLSVVELTSAPGKDGGDGPVLSYSLKCGHDGGNHNVNSMLMNACRRTGPLSWNITEENFGLLKRVDVDFRSLPVSMKLVDNGWAGYGETQLAIVVNNPSRLPLNVDYWQFVTVNRYHDASLMDEAVAKVNGQLHLGVMEYVVNQYSRSSMPVYGSSYAFVSEYNGYGTPAVEDGDKLVYNLKGVDTDNLIAALTYDGWGYDSMSHHMQVTFADGSPVDDLTVEDCLSDGAFAFELKYSAEGLDDRGIWLYDGATLILAPEDLFDQYPGLSPYNVRDLKSQISVIGNMVYDTDASRVYITADELGSSGLMLDSYTEAIAAGYVMTYPNGTLGKPKDNFCDAMLQRECKGFTVRHIEGKEVPDGDTVRDVFQQIYQNVYFDSWNKIGSANSYLHSAHPVSLSVKMSFRLSDINDKSAQLFKPLFPSYIYYSHAQDALEYRIPVNFSYDNFKFVDVRNK